MLGDDVLNIGQILPTCGWEVHAHPFPPPNPLYITLPQSSLAVTVYGRTVNNEGT